MIENYYLGCPMWGIKEWVGPFYRPKTAAKNFLKNYASVFNTVEGNTTFYSVPTEQTVARWRESTPEDFRFSFKLPRTITHEAGLRDSGIDLRFFLRRLAPLGDRLGPFMIQLPPSFGPDRLHVLEGFLSGLPRALGDVSFDYAAELRHPAFYTSPEAMQQVDTVLAQNGVERVVMDTRALRSGDPDHPHVLAARHKKPDLPVMPVALSHRPMVRFIGHPDSSVNDPWLEIWQRQLAEWIHQGKTPYFFTHLPDNVHTPQLAREFHQRLSLGEPRVNVGELPVFPAEQPPEPEAQLSLF